jgi:predicted esterase
MYTEQAYRPLCLCLSLFSCLTNISASAMAAPPATPAAAPTGPGIASGKASFEARLPGAEIIEVFTYRARRHGPDDPIVILLAGGGRNGSDYRDSWIEAAERFDLLLLAPSFDETQFPGPIRYNLAGMIGNDADVSTLRNFTLAPPETWLFSDIEAIFDQAVARTGSVQTRYDLFGHSAGAQIVHRMVLFAPETRIHTAVAANSGWYTAPTPDVPFPYGLGGLSLPRAALARAYSRDLVLLLGEQDDARETRGHLRESPEADAQGKHRLARGQNFHAVATREGARLGIHPNWRLEIVSGVGHDYRKMGEAAARYLYGKPSRTKSQPVR